MTKQQYLLLRSQLDFTHNKKIFLLQILIDAGLVALTAGLLSQDSAMVYWAALPIAVIMLRNLSVMHEAVHDLAHPNPKINYFVGLIAGSLCLLPFHLWKKIHIQHHYWAGNFHKDPALEIIKRYPQASAFSKFLYAFSWKSRLPIIAFAQYLVFWFHSALELIKNIRQPVLWFNLLTPVAIWTAVISQLHGKHFAAFGLGVLAYLLIFEFVNLVHHVGIYLNEGESAKRPTWQQYEVTRSAEYFAWFERIFLLNFNYHAEHHMFPDLPWHKLPQAHALVQGSEIAKNTMVIKTGWLKEQRKLAFEDYLLPESYRVQETKGTAPKKAA